MGRKPIREDGRPLTDAEKARRYRAATALRRKKAVVALKQARRTAALALKGTRQPGADIWRPGDPRRFTVLYADPPWRFEPWSRSTGLMRSADLQYVTMTTADIAAMAVPAAEDCALFLWATAPMLPRALEVMAAWGFSYKSHIVWAKDRIGTGYWVRNQHELLLIGARGNIPAPAPGTQESSLRAAPVGAHSAKPGMFADMIVTLFPGVARLEMFARERREGWTSHGNELTG